MKEMVQPNRINLKPFSLGWLNYYGFSGALLFFGLYGGFFYFRTTDIGKSSTFMSQSLIFISLGCLCCYIQFQKLKYKTFKLIGNLDEFKIQVKRLLNENNWRIDYDNQTFIQATNNEGLGILNVDMLTLRFKKNEIQWNVIRHPHDHNSILSLLTFNSKGNKIISKIIFENASLKK